MSWFNARRTKEVAEGKIDMHWQAASAWYRQRIPAAARSSKASAMRAMGEPGPVGGVVLELVAIAARQGPDAMVHPPIRRSRQANAPRGQRRCGKALGHRTMALIEGRCNSPRCSHQACRRPSLRPQVVTRRPRSVIDDRGCATSGVSTGATCSVRACKPFAILFPLCPLWLAQ